MTDIKPYERNQIYCGQSEELLARLPDDCIDLTVTSPPYDNLRDYNGFTLDWHVIIEQLYRVTKPGGVVVWVVADATIKGSETGTSFKQALWAIECGFNLHDTMIWAKDGSPFPDKTRYKNTFEYMFVFSKGRPLTFNAISDRVNKQRGNAVNATDREASGETRVSWGQMNGVIYSDYGPRFNVWYLDAEKRNGVRQFHPAAMAAPIARDHIISWSNPGDIVLDPFVGSGTTAKMAFQNGRDYLGFDVSEEYCELTRRRIAQANPPLPLFDKVEETELEPRQQGLF